MKTFRRLTAMAFATVCALSAAPSFAATANNGINLNGIGWNGIGWNGIGWNGIGWNSASKPFTHQLSQLASEPLL